MLPSASRIDVRIGVHGKGQACGEVFRHLAPVTLNNILRKAPIEGRVVRVDDSYICVLSGLALGVEKARNGFKRGDIAFLALNGALCIFLKDSVIGRPMNPLGRVTSGMEILENAGPGDTITLAF